jgi:hypothetical protein
MLSDFPAIKRPQLTQKHPLIRKYTTARLNTVNSKRNSMEFRVPQWQNTLPLLYDFQNKTLFTLQQPWLFIR